MTGLNRTRIQLLSRSQYPDDPSKPKPVNRAGAAGRPYHTSIDGALAALGFIRPRDQQNSAPAGFEFPDL